ncbi:hypothetical protein CDCA_CDCA04G1162 [Cyanidium caldarium]|uniref:Uncharacterized protein n=1 Tax=Cyanidium caldarium TaxID=2771 RepID=A0AAV9IS15_CYACA|nr:hypothetical protein CDCA_CDCA04G1162 [Cyanidium caldarium]
MSTSSNCAQVGVENYSNPLHVAGLFVILIAGFTGSFLPVASARFPRLRIPGIVLQIGRAFGTGVVIATGFVHMMPPALVNLSNPCLPGFFTDTYNSFGAALALVAALSMQLLEFTGRVYVARYAQRLQGKRMEAAGDAKVQKMDGEGSSGGATPPGPIAEADERHTVAESPPSPGADGIQCERSPSEHVSVEVPESGKADAAGIDERNLKLLVLVFEFGVAVHSVIVGLDFGVSTGQTAITLFAALIFHQFFEGVALGTTIAAAGFDWWLSLLMVIGFALETPLGIAIGMGIASGYTPNSDASLLTRGILDSLSAGILIYTGLVELLTYFFTINAQFQMQALKWIVVTMTALWLGAICMSIVGAWI